MTDVDYTITIPPSARDTLCETGEVTLENQRGDTTKIQVRER